MSEELKNEIKVDEKVTSIERKLIIEKMSKKDKADIWIKIITLIFTGCAVLATFATYFSAQKWKKAEFVYSTYKQFSENKSVLIANKLLDYNRARVFLDNDSAMFIEEDFVLFSLRIDTLNGDFNYPQGKIRDVFDDYLDQLSLFNRFAKTGLITYDEMKPYLIYQISIIADRNNLRKSQEFRRGLWDYINYYKYNDVRELCENLGYDIDKK